MRKDKTIESVFYDGHIQSANSFIKFMSKSDIQMFVLSANKEINGICWITPMHFKSVWIHFCCFSNAWGKLGKDLCRWALRNLLHQKDEAGEFMINTICGITPANNEYAKKFIFDVGMQSCGILPGICHDYYQDKFVDGIVTYINREE
jgi:hypothetical protein